MSSDEKCKCGNKRQNLNTTNWLRHTSSCKIRKLNTFCNNNIQSYFEKPKDTLNEKKLKLGK